MSERTFTYTWSDARRLTVLHALGFMYAKLATAPPAVSETVLSLVNELSSKPGADSGTEAARAVLSPPPLAPNAQPQAWRDHFAADRKGNVPAKAPNGSELQTIPIVSASEAPDSKGKHLAVIFGGGRGKANCFDPQLWPLIKKAQGHEAQLWILVSGNYLNIVGVRV
jgi:hypothetical protein